jgi:hypothetical protein
MFASRGIIAAQVLLTFGDTEERRRYLNARATLLPPPRSNLATMIGWAHASPP